MTLLPTKKVNKVKNEQSEMKVFVLCSLHELMICLDPACPYSLRSWGFYKRMETVLTHETQRMA